MSVGYNHIDLAACTARQVLVTNTPDVLTESTADFGFALLMATARRMSEGERLLRDGQLEELGLGLPGRLRGARLPRSASWAWVASGRRIARRGRFGFGMQVAYHNRSRLPAETESRARCALRLSKDELLRQADHLILVLPYSTESHHCIGAA